MTEIGYRMTLPTTGYVIVHTSTVDGADPMEATIFIDLAGKLDDAGALARLERELDLIRMWAPRNVLHRQVLIHRTAEGDRILSAPDPVRGPGEPYIRRDSASRSEE